MSEDMNTLENKLPQIEANETVEAHEEKNRKKQSLHRKKMM